MTTSSQTEPPAEAFPVRPIPLVQALDAVTSQIPSAPPEPPARPAVSPLSAATGVIQASMTRGGTSPREIAQAEQDAGLLFSPELAREIAAAASEQAHAECRVELMERGRQLAAMAGYKRHLDAVLRLCEGRPGTDMLTVAEIATTAGAARSVFDAFPMTLSWTGRVTIPDVGMTGKGAVIHCISSHGGRADVVIRGDARLSLAGQLTPEAEATPEDAAGATDERGAEAEVTPDEPPVDPEHAGESVVDGETRGDAL